MATTLTVWEPLPELNRKNEDGNFIIKRPEGRLKLFDMGSIYSCCGRAFLTLESLQNHSKDKCLLLDANAEDRPLEFDKLYRPGYFANLLVMNEIRRSRLKHLENLKSSLPTVTVVLERINPSKVIRTKTTPIETLSDSLTEMPQLSPIKDQNNDDADAETEVLSPLTEQNSAPPVIEPIVPLWDLCLPEENTSPEEEIRYYCDFCSFSSKFKNNWKNHVKREHRSSWKRSKHTEMKHSSKPLKQNIVHERYNIKKTEPFKKELSKTKNCKMCKFCGFWVSIGAYKRHIEKAHVKSGIKCLYCCCSFASNLGRKVHVTLYHKKNSYVKETRIRSNRDPSPKKEIAEQIFQCKLCSLRFKNRFNWNFHVQNCHVPGSLFACRFCTCSFKSKNSLNVHVAYHHKRESGQLHVKASQFKSEVKQIKVSNHKSPEISTGSISCDICGKNLKSKCFVKIHTRVAHVPGGEPCPFCPCQFANMRQLKVHITRHHLKLKESITNSESGFVKSKKTRMSEKGDSNEELKEDFIRCPEPDCKCPILDKETLELHLKLEHKHTKPKELTTKKSLECFFCPESFETSEERSLHSKRNHEKWFPLHQQKKLKVGVPCDLCPTKIYYAAQLKYHLRTAHNPSFNHKCSLCSCQYETELGLRSHVSKVHKFDSSDNSTGKEGERPRQCPLCNRLFYNHKHMKSHLLNAHVPNGKYQCPFCICCYNLKSSLNAHVLNLHKKSSGKSNYKCEKCGWHGRNSEELKYHLKRSHVRDGKFPCTMCCCCFSNSSRLTNHLSKVHYVLNYEIIKCDQCFIEVYSQRELAVHQKFAHVTNGVECKHCPCKFTSKLYLDDHLKKDHPESTENANATAVRTCRLVLPKYTADPLIEEKDNTGKTSKPPTILCQVVNCNFKFHTNFGVKKHMQNSHNEEHKFQCEKCPCAFANELGLRIHLSRWHRKRHISEDLTTPVKKPKLDETVKEENSTPEKSTPVKDSFVENEKNDSIYPSSDSDTSDVVEITPPPKEKPKTPPMNITCRCKKCGTVFTSTEKLLDHLKNVHGVNSLFKCSVCAATFVNPLLLTNHLLTHAPSEGFPSPKKTKEAKQKKSDSREKSTKIASSKNDRNFKSRNSEDISDIFSCKKCTNVFDSLIQLGLHMQLKHGTSGIDCEFCSSSFDSTTNLIIHQTIYHTDENRPPSKANLKENGNDSASANGSDFEHACAISDALNTQITSDSEQNRTFLRSDSASMCHVEAVIEQDKLVECEILHKELCIEELPPDFALEEFPSDFDDIITEDSVRNENVDVIDLTNENSNDSCAIVAIVLKAGEKSAKDNNNVRNSIDVPTRFANCSRNSRELIVERRKSRNSMTKGKTGEKSRNSVTTSLGKTGESAESTKDCAEQLKNSGNEEFPEVQFLDSNYFGEIGDALERNYRPSSIEIEEMLADVNILCSAVVATSKTPEDTSLLLNPSACDTQSNCHLLNKETTSNTGETSKDTGAASASVEVEDVYERTASELSTDYDDDWLDMDYSDICFRCGETILNRSQHETRCFQINYLNSEKDFSEEEIASARFNN